MGESYTRFGLHTADPIALPFFSQDSFFMFCCSAVEHAAGNQRASSRRMQILQTIIIFWTFTECHTFRLNSTARQFGIFLFVGCDCLIPLPRPALPSSAQPLRKWGKCAVRRGVCDVARRMRFHKFLSNVSFWGQFAGCLENRVLSPSNGRRTPAAGRECPTGQGSAALGGEDPTVARHASAPTLHIPSRTAGPSPSCSW